MLRIPRLFLCLCLMLGGLLPLPAWARVSIDPLTATSTVNWTSGDVVFETPFCVESIQEAGPPGNTIIPYDVNVNIGGTGQAYALWAGGVGPGVPVTVQWTNIAVAPAVTYTLSPNVTTARVMTGRAPNDCPGLNNARLTLRVLASQLASLAPGSYTRSFTVTVTNAGAGRKSHAATVTLTVNIPLIARISGFEDIVLGTWDGASDMTGSDGLCVYRNSAGPYTVTATGGAPDGTFILTSSTATVPFQVRWNDGGGPVAMTANTPLTGRANAWTAGDGCGGGSNATVLVTVPATALSAAPLTGNYSGVLTILYTTQ